MNEQDKQAFQDYKNTFHGNMSPNNDDYGNRDSGFKHGWQAACEYKQKEIDVLLEKIRSIDCYIERDKKLVKLKEQNKKLREALKFTVHAAEYLYKPEVKLNKGMTPTFYFTLTYEGDLELMEKTIEARQVLKECYDSL